jgi:cytochrome P450 family 6
LISLFAYTGLQFNKTEKPVDASTRNAIYVTGMRFGLMQTKVGVVSVLSKYDVRASEETPRPMVLDKRGILLSPKGNLWLKLVNRQDRLY